MFLKEEFSFEIIDDSLTVEYLQDWCHENDINLHLCDNASTWCAFAQYYARTHDLDVLASTSFAYIISSLFAGMGVSASTEIYFRENEISFDAIEHLNQLRKDFDDEEYIARMLFFHIFNIYHDNIWKYEFKDQKICLRVGESTMAKIESAEGKTISEKIMNLLYM